MAKTVLKVTILDCGVKAKDSTGREYDIDFTFSNEEKMNKAHGVNSFSPGTKHRGQIQANQKIEIL